MKFKSALVTAVSGSIGGMTGSHNRGGMYLRARATPTNPQTCKQSKARAAFGNASHAFNNTLTQAERDAWATYAAGSPYTPPFCGPIELTARQWYVKSNQPRIYAGLPSVHAAPTTMGMAPAPDPATEADWDGTAETVTLTVTFPEPATDDGNILLWHGLPQQTQPLYGYDDEWYFLDSYEFAITDEEVVMSSPYSAFPFDPELALFVPFKMSTLLDDGRVSDIIICPDVSMVDATPP